VVQKKRIIVIGILLIVFTAALVFAATGANAQREPGGDAMTKGGLPVPAAPQAATIFNNTDPLITVSQCNNCHGSNYDNFNDPGLIFKHDPHLARGVRCAACHTGAPHKPGVTNKPSMDVCFNCHGVSHQEQGVVASGSCTLCHPVGFKRLPQNHTAQFKEKTHRESAKANSFSCLACHGNDFCTKCHSVKKVLPRDHGKIAAEKVVWKKQHGKSDLDGCSICHSKQSCLNCHGTEMPHPVYWLATHKDPEKANKKDCKTCHEAKTECSTCHHQFQLTTILTQKACERCHDDYKKSLQELLSRPKSQRSTGIIIHKAHFKMRKTDPYECSECHDRGYAEAKECFSFELCYGCHGRERGGSPIARWGGQELCYRCHKMN
jgi:hypothetical protein